jgi:hypothetical protein
MANKYVHRARWFAARSARKGLTLNAHTCASGCDPIRLVVFVCVSLALGLSVAAAEDKLTYDDHAAAVLKQRCSSCHNPTAKKADLDITNYVNLMQGGASGPSIEPGDADGSYLFTLVTHEAEPHMPQKADKLPDAEIDMLRRWINGGALENAGSKAAKPKPKMNFATEGSSGAARPKVIPLPPRLVLEPALRLAKSPMARSLATSPWATLVAVASQRQVLLYDTKSLELVGVFPFPEGQPNVVRFSRDGRFLLAGGGRPAVSGKVVLWDITTGERAFEIGNELDAVLSADISADHKLVALGGPQRRVKVYSTETGDLKYELTKHTDWVLSVEFSPDGVLLATADRNGGLCVWEADSGNEYLTLLGHTAAVNAVKWRGDSNVLASASEDQTVRLWEMENGNVIRNWNTKTPNLSMDFTRAGQIVTTGRDQIVRLWAQDGKPLKAAKPLGDIAVSVAYCDESQRMIAANWAGAVKIYNSDDAAEVGSFVTNPTTLEERLAAAKATLGQQSAACAPLRETVQRVDAELKKSQATLVAAQQEAAKAQAAAEKLTAEGSKLSQARAAADGERAKTVELIAQNEAARPLVAEALRQVTEAIAKVPNDANLAEAQKQLTEQQQVMEGGSAELKAKVAELAAAVANADGQIKEVQARTEKAAMQSAAAAERVKSLQAESEQRAKTLADAQDAAKPAEAALADAQKSASRWQDEIAFRDRMAALQKELENARKIAAERQATLNEANKKLADSQSTANSAKQQADAAMAEEAAITAKIQAARSK